MLVVVVNYAGNKRDRNREKRILRFSEGYGCSHIETVKELGSVRMNFDFYDSVSAINFVGKGVEKGLFTLPD